MWKWYLSRIQNIHHDLHEKLSNTLKNDETIALLSRKNQIEEIKISPVVEAFVTDGKMYSLLSYERNGSMFFAF